MDKNLFAQKDETKNEAETDQEEKEFTNLHERIASIIRTISKQSQITVTSELSPADRMQLMMSGKDPDNTWFAQAEKQEKNGNTVYKYTRVVIPKKMVFTNEDIPLGIGSHEASHVYATRIGQVVPDQVMKEIGFGSMLMAAEERSTDQLVREYYPGAGQWLDKSRQNSHNKAKSYLRKSGEKKIKQPRFEQINNLIVYRPQMDDEDIQSQIDPDVLDIYKKIDKHVKSYEHTLPSDNAEEEEILAAAKERYKIAYKKIWPQLKKMVQQDIEDQKVKEELKAASQQKNNDLQKELDKLPPHLKKELEKLQKELQEQIKEELQQEQQKLQKQIDQKEQAIEQSQKSPQDKQKAKQEMQTKQKQSRQDSQSLDKPEEDQNLSQNAQKRLEQKMEQAKEDMKDELQDQINDIEQELEDLYKDQNSTPEEKAKKSQELEENLKQAKEDLRALEDGKEDQLSQETKEKLEQKKEQARQDLKQELEQEQNDLQDQMNDLDKDTEQLQAEKQALEQQLQQNQADQKSMKQDSVPPNPSPSMQKAMNKAASKIDANQISQELKNELQKAIQKVSQEMMQQLQEAAEQFLKDLEDEMIKEMSAQLDPEAPRTHQQMDKEEKAEQEAEEQQQRKKEMIEKNKKSEPKNREELNKIDQKLKELEKHKTIYEGYYQKIRLQEAQLYRFLDEVFNPNIRSNKILKSTGVTPNLPAVFKWEANKGAAKAGVKINVSPKIFEVTHTPEKKDYAISMINDVSGSMEGDPAKQDLKAKIILSEVLNRLGIKFEIWSFGNDKINKLKDIDHKLTDNIRDRVAGVLQADGGTPTHAAINTAQKKFKTVPCKEKFMLVLTDGAPDSFSSTAKEIKKLYQETDIKLIGIGMDNIPKDHPKEIGPAGTMVQRLFPISLATTFERLPEDLANLLKDLILNPQRYNFKGAEIEKFYNDTGRGYY